MVSILHSVIFYHQIIYFHLVFIRIIWTQGTWFEYFFRRSLCIFLDVFFFLHYLREK